MSSKEPWQKKHAGEMAVKSQLSYWNGCLLLGDVAEGQNQLQIAFWTDFLAIVAFGSFLGVHPGHSQLITELSLVHHSIGCFMIFQFLVNPTRSVYSDSTVEIDKKVVYIESSFDV